MKARERIALLRHHLESVDFELDHAESFKALPFFRLVLALPDELYRELIKQLRRRNNQDLIERIEWVLKWRRFFDEQVLSFEEIDQTTRGRFLEGVGLKKSLRTFLYEHNIRTVGVLLQHSLEQLKVLGLTSIGEQQLTAMLAQRGWRLRDSVSAPEQSPES